jgi:hypothetical protein
VDRARFPFEKEQVHSFDSPPARTGCSATKCQRRIRLFNRPWGPRKNAAGDRSVNCGFPSPVSEPDPPPPPVMAKNPPPPSPSSRACGPPKTGFGMGVLAGGSAETGVVKAGASLQGSVGAGAFVNGDAQPSLAVFASGGAVANAGNHVAAAPAQQQAPAVFGAYAGYGPGAFITNAGSGQQLEGPFWTVTVNLGLGPGKASVSLASSNGVWVLSATGGIEPWSMGIGFSVSTITTTTAAKSTSRCP